MASTFRQTSRSISYIVEAWGTTKLALILGEPHSSHTQLIEPSRLDTRKKIPVQAQSEFHELVLYSSRVHIINRVSQTLVQDLSFHPRSLGISSPFTPLAFAEDVAAGAIYIYNGTVPCSSSNHPNL